MAHRVLPKKPGRGMSSCWVKITSSPAGMWKEIMVIRVKMMQQFEQQKAPIKTFTLRLVGSDFQKSSSFLVKLKKVTIGLTTAIGWSVIPTARVFTV